MINTDSKESLPYAYRESKAWIAPSWSWASVEGPISFAWCQHDYAPKDYLATLEAAHITLQSQNIRFGMVESGYVSLLAPVATMLWGVDDSLPGHLPRAGRITHIYPRGHNSETAIYFPPNMLTKSEIIFDEIIANVSAELILVPVIGTSKRIIYESEMVLGLVLQQIPHSERCTRLGIFSTTRPRVRRILMNLPRQPVTIL